MNNWHIATGDIRTKIQELRSNSIQCVVTSPPYFGLRDYGTASWEGGDTSCDHTPSFQPRSERPVGKLRGAGSTNDAQDRGAHAYRSTCGKCGATRVDAQVGLEDTPEQYIATIVKISAEIHRILREDGTFWLNLGDTYASGNGGFSTLKIKHKDLTGIPWRVAFELQSAGWYLRSDIIWAKLNPMPESVTDRPTRAHEYLFLLAKSDQYYYDAAAIAEHIVNTRKPGRHILDTRITHGMGGGNAGLNDFVSRYHEGNPPEDRNTRSVWHIATQPYPGAHYAVMPEALAEPCVLAGSKPGDTVFDPFTGSGTTGVVAIRHERNFYGIELSPDHVEQARTRIGAVAPLFASEEPSWLAR